MGRRLDHLLGHEADACVHRAASAGAKFCPDCGKQLTVQRYNWDDLFGGPPAVHWQKVFRRTLWGLFSHPGRNIRTFLFSDRNHLVKPMAYLTLTLAFTIWTQHLIEGPTSCSADDKFCRFVDDNYYPLELSQIFLLALVYRFVFRRYVDYRLSEYVAGFAYIVAQSCVLTGIVYLALWGAGPDVRLGTAFILRNVFMIIVIVQFLGIRGRYRIAGALALGVGTIVLFLLLSFLVLSVLFVATDGGSL